MIKHRNLLSVFGFLLLIITIVSYFLYKKIQKNEEQLTKIEKTITPIINNFNETKEQYNHLNEQIIKIAEVINREEENQNTVYSVSYNSEEQIRKNNINYKSITEDESKKIKNELNGNFEVISSKKDIAIIKRTHASNVLNDVLNDLNDNTDLEIFHNEKPLNNMLKNNNSNKIEDVTITKAIQLAKFSRFLPGDDK